MTIHNFGLQEPPEANRTLQDALRRLHPANPAAHWANPEAQKTAPTTAGHLLRRLITRNKIANRRLAHIAKHHPAAYLDALENAGRGEDV